MLSGVQCTTPHAHRTHAAPPLQYISYGTILGGRCYIELGMACEASGDAQRAVEIYRQVELNNGDAGLKRQAKQLAFGERSVGWRVSVDPSSNIAVLFFSTLADFRNIRRPVAPP